MSDNLTESDFSELEHIETGGIWCLDGRKEKRLIRLGLLDAEGAYGLRITDDGIAALNLRGSVGSAIKWPPQKDDG